MKRFCSQNIRKVKNDRIDAIHIASYGLTYWHELIPVQSSEDTYRELLLLSRQYHNVIDLLIKAKMNFGNLLDQVMPGITSIIRDDRGSKLTEFVKKYVHFQHIDSMGETRFVRDFCKWSQKQGYRVDHERQARKIYALVQNGIPVLPHTPTTKIVVLEALRRVNELENSRDIILAQMNELGKTLPEYSLISEMKCIGEGLTPRIIAEIGDIRRFHNKHSLIAYAGIDAPPYQSGSYNATERHITKRGNKYLRKVIFEVCLSYIQHKPEGDPVYEFIEKKRSEGKCGKEALVAGINKFLRVYYGKVTELYRELEL
jgi:transposase